MNPFQIPRYFLVLLTLLVALTSACSDDQSDSQCTGVVCPVGSCDAATGQCINPDTCEFTDECLPGFACEEGECATDLPCNDTEDCAAGVCIHGACVNPATCTVDDQCLQGHRCDDGQCVEDACSGVVCDRGVCDRTSGECVNEIVCTAENQEQTCLEGYACYGGECETEAFICSEITCDRGVCDAATQSCVSAELCADDTECLANSFCEDGTCTLNRCDSQGIACLRGVCDLRTTSCENAPSCTSNTQCIDGFSCIGTTCTPIGEECGVDGCPGNQRCDINETTRTGTCIENPGGCANAIDCQSGRVCDMGRCAPPTPCSADAYEPNDTTPTVFDQVMVSNTIDGSICQGDTDVFTFDTTTEPEFTGLLVVDLAFDQNDVGNGELQLTLKGIDGATIGQETSANGRVRIEWDVSVVTRGIYTIEIADIDSTISGIDYNLFVDLMEPSLASACLQAPELALGTESSGNTSSGASFEYGSNCTAEDNPTGEDIYTFSVDVRSLVRVNVQPQNNADLVASIRSRCESIQSELGCIDPVGTGTVVLERVLPAGDYYVLVEGALNSPGGEYDIEVTAQPTICTSFDNMCINPTASQTCNPSGTGFINTSCANGCDDDSGSCIRTPGDLCGEAVNVTGGDTVIFEWNDFENDYDPGFSGCVPGGSSVTAGPDAAFFASLQPGHVLDVNLERASGDDVSLYLVRDCANTSTSCVLGSNAGTFSNERLVYENTSGVVEDLYIIADVEDDSGYGSATLTVVDAPVVCTPGNAQCVGSELESCNDTGTATSLLVCSAGCSNNQCNPVTNDECDTPIDITASTTIVGRIEEFVSDYNPGTSSCTPRSAFGRDAVYSVTPPAGQIVSITLNPDFDASLWVTGSTCAADACVAGSDNTGVGPEFVQFLADGSTYRIIVDSQSSSTVTGQFVLSYGTQSPTCTPGANLGCQGSSLQYCSDVGLPASLTCSTTCTNNACDDPAGDLCIDALPVGSGLVTGNFSGTNDIDTGAGLVGECFFVNGEQGIGEDTIYAIDLNAGEYLFAELNSTFNTTMYVLGDCSNLSSCRTNTPEASSSNIIYAAQGSERVYLVVDRTSSSSTSTTFDLDIDIRVPNCGIGTPPFCGVDGTTLNYCDGLGFAQTYSCDGACVVDACETPTGDVCADPIPIVAPASISDTVPTNGVNDIQPRVPFDGSCIWDDIDEPDGEEKIYAIDLVAGDLLRVQLESSSSYPMLYLLDSCEDTSSCLANTFQQGDVELLYRAEVTKTYFLVVDSTSPFSSSSFEMTVDVTQGAVCTPNAGRCLTGGILERCDSTGQTTSTVVCTNGCSRGACAPEDGMDGCLTAPNVGSGISVLTSFSEYIDDINLTSNDCLGRTSPGPDAMYEVTLSPGEVLRARVQSLGSEDPIVYVVGDCNNAASTCLEHGLADSDDLAEVYYTAQGNETVYVVADGTSSSWDEPFRFEIDVLPIECIPPASYCSTDGTTLQYCNGYGIFDSYRCDGTCTGATCDDPRGDICADAIPMADGSIYSSTYGDYQNDLDPGVGTCVLYGSNRPDGPDSVFQINMQAGDLLEARLNTTTSTSSLYILDECGNERDSCIIANTDAKELDFVAPLAKTYFLVVDSDSPTVTSSFTLTTNITPGYVCSPGRSTCEGGVQTICDESGLNLIGIANCSNGCANDEFCAPAPGLPDTCATAEVLLGGARLTDAFSRFTNDYDPGSSGCAGTTASGNDAAYQINLNTGDVLLASVTPSNTFDSVRVYIVTDCSDVTANCVGGDNASSGSTATAGYVAQGNETVYVIVDSSSSFDTDPYILDVQIRQAECGIGQQRCIGDARQTCSDLGIWQTDQNCYFGCTTGACNPTPNDSCLTALDATSGGVFSFPPSLYTDTVTPDAGTGDSCTGYKADGPDAHYRLDLNAGDYVRISMEGPSDSALWVSDRCASSAQMADACLVGDDGGDPETVEFIAPQSRTYYVVADHYSPTSSGVLANVNFQVQQAGTCVADTSSCVDGTTVSYCDDGGTILVEDSCTGGCANGECGSPTGEWCGQALDVTAGGMFQINMDLLENDYTFASGVCTGSSPGNDAVLKADLDAGDIFLVEVTAPSGENPALYMTDSCGSLGFIGADCLVSSNESGVTEVIRYDATVADTIYAVIDSTGTGTDDGTWDVDVYVGPPAPNNVCGGAVDVTAGGQFSTKLGLLTDDYSPTAGSGMACTSGAPGPEAVFSVNATAGDFIQLELVSGVDAVLWVSTDCTDAAAAADNCILGSNEMGTETLSFFAPATGTYFIFADAIEEGTQGEIVLDVALQPGGTCTTGASTCVDANTVSYCDNGGTLLREDACDGGCNAGECANPTGDWCGQAIDGTGGGVFPINMDNLTNDFTFISSVCAGSTPGNDAVFRVDLAANETLDVLVTAPSGNNPLVYLAQNCAGISDDLNTMNCVAVDDTSSTNSEAFVYTATAAETVYLVVDSAQATDGDWVVDILGGTTCTSGELACIGNWTASCNVTGDRFTPATECSGGCANGGCLGDSCIAPIPLADGEQDTQFYSGTNDSDVGTGMLGACDFTSTQVGTDHMYTVDLLAGQTLTASFTSTSSYGFLWAATDCTMGSTCLANSTIGQNGSITYTATVDETIFLIMDRTLSGSTTLYEYTLSVDVQ